MFTPLFTHSFVHLSKINLLFIQTHADVMQTCYTCNNCIWLTDGEFLIWLKPMITNLEHLLEKINCICFQLYILQKKMNIFFTFYIFWSYYIMYQTCYIFSKHYFSNCQHFCIHRHEKHLSLLIGEVFNNKSEQNSKKKLSLIINWDLKYNGALRNADNTSGTNNRFCTNR